MGSNLMNGYRYLFRNVKPFWERNGGKICTIVGTTGLFFSGVHACRTTYKHHDDLSRLGDDIRTAKRKVDGESRSKRAGRIGAAAVKATISAGKFYLPDMVAAGLSSYITSKGWGIEHTHYENAATMVGVLAADFANYRRNVIAEHGREADRRYMTRRRSDDKLNDAKIESDSKSSEKIEGEDGFSISVDPGMLKIWYSKETTPQVWSESRALRMNHLEGIANKLDNLLMYGGHFSVNDVRREFYGVKGDVACGGMFGRVWDPGNPDHPERGRLVNLHYQEDQDFMDGVTDSCWIFIDIDDEPLFESLSPKTLSDIPGVEYV